MTSTNSTPPQKQGRLAGFDGLRALSALVVFVEHKVRDIGTGAIGVWIFYVLSGYLIVGILQRSRASIEAGKATKFEALLDFWRNRALRILPLYYAVVLTVFAFSHVLDRTALAYYLVYLQNFYIAWVSHGWSATSHLWSLANEQQFYLAAAPLLLLLGARSHRATLLAIFVSCLLLCVLASVLGWDGMAFSLLPPANFAFMALGGLLYLSPSDSRLWRVLGHPAAGIATALTFAIVFVLTRSSYDPMAGTALVVYLSGLAFASSLVACVVASPTSSFVRFLETRPLRWFGSISYGFYVYHALLPGPEKLTRRFAALAAVPPVVWIGLELALGALLADLSWRWFEQRFLALKRRPRPAAG